VSYPELLRVQRLLLVFTIIVAIPVVVTVCVGFFSHGTVSTGAGAHTLITSYSLRDSIAEQFTRERKSVPFFALESIAGLAALVIASILGGFLANERSHTPLAWTKPVSRERFALAYMGVDAAGIVASFLIALVLGVFGIMWGLGMIRFTTVDPDVWTTLLLVGGGAFAYYGLVRAASQAFPERPSAIAGASWPILLGLAAMHAAPIPTALHDIIVALNFLNPLAYFGRVESNGSDTGLLPLAGPLRIACLWLLAVVYGAVAVVLYRRAEA